MQAHIPRMGAGRAIITRPLGKRTTPTLRHHCRVAADLMGDSVLSFAEPTANRAYGRGPPSGYTHVIRVITTMGGQIEGHRKAGLSPLEVLAVEGV